MLKNRLFCIILVALLTIYGLMPISNTHPTGTGVFSNSLLPVNPPTNLETPGQVPQTQVPSSPPSQPSSALSPSVPKWVEVQQSSHVDFSDAPHYSNTTGYSQLINNGPQSIPKPNFPPLNPSTGIDPGQYNATGETLLPCVSRLKPGKAYMGAGYGDEYGYTEWPIPLLKGNKLCENH